LRRRFMMEPATSVDTVSSYGNGGLLVVRFMAC
jgi:hypothetical protein